MRCVMHPNYRAMKILGYEIKKAQTTEQKTPQPSSRAHNWVGRRGPAVNEYFDGEKTPNELGYLKNLIPDYRGLRYRAFEAELKSDIVKIITGKFFKWVIGTGLRLEAEPNETVLETEGITSIPENFRRNVEARFSVYAKSHMCDYKRMDNLHNIAAEAFKAAFLGGDALCILRVGKLGNVNVQVIDGEHVQTPVMRDDLMEAVKQRGNDVRHGVEISKTGEHVSYFVRVFDNDNIMGEFKRIPARGAKSGKLLAWLVYGDKHRIDHVRGIPIITQILEKVDKLDRYTEAAVGTMEERSKIVMAIEHSKDSDGENPLLNKVKIARGKGTNDAVETEGYALGEKTAELIAATTQKDTFNLPIGARLVAPLDSQLAVDYGPFSKAVFVFLCASVNVPPEVALQLYEQNYSSSRAAIKSWEFIVNTFRERFSDKFYKNFYNLWIELEVVNNKVKAPGFLEALRSDNYMAIEAYSTARFKGSNMPHIDPLKEVKSVREILGANDSTPLASREQATEMLGLGDWSKNIEKYKKETEEAPEIPKENESDSSNQNGGQGGSVDSEQEI